MLTFRTLYRNEIECRIATVTAKGVSLLLYKDARVDQNILDESMGPMNWQRDHKELKGNIYCGVSIYDDHKGEWVTKWDCGKESNTEAEKGEASDSFKRACFNWGIGRELYTAPFIWVGSENCNLVDTGRKNNKNEPVYTCRDKFYVEQILYDKNKNIVALSIKNASNNKRAFLMDKREKEA